MGRNYFEDKNSQGKQILLKICIALFNGLLFITSLRLDKNMTGGYRLTMFFNRKDE